MRADEPPAPLPHDGVLFADGACSFCGARLDAGETAAHLRAHLDEVRDFTLGFIRKLHPEWVAADGSCPRCDRYYDEL